MNLQMLNLFFSTFLTDTIKAIAFFAVTFLSFQPLMKKRNYTLKLVVLGALTLALVIAFSLLNCFIIAASEEILDFIFLLSLYLLSLFFIFITYSGDIKSIFCYLLVALASFNIQYALINIINSLITDAFNINSYLLAVIDALLATLLIICIYFFVIRGYIVKNLIATNKYSPIIFFIFIAVLIILSIFRLLLQDRRTNYFIFIDLIQVLYAIFTLSIAYSIIQKAESAVELTILKKLWDEDKKQYSLIKENIETINIRCHDLKHQFMRLKDNQGLKQEEVAEIEKSIDIYNSSIKTENEALDIILTNYQLRATNNEIQLTCMADGKLLDFINQVDLYSLFGNMLSNAFEYVQKLDKEKRFISLTIFQEGKLVHIHCENYYEGGDLNCVNGRIISTKKDKSVHGFGMISMQQIVTRYGGKFSYEIADKMFQVDIYIPLRGEKDEQGKE